MTRRTRLQVSIAIALPVLTILALSNAWRQARWVEVPHACDWFIFLRQAQLFKDKGLIGGLDTDIRDLNTRYVINKANSLSSSNPNFGKPPVPLCHHYRADIGRVSIVSPPGTGLGLSFFPVGQQARLAFITYTTIIFLSLSIVVLTARRWTVPLIAGILGAIYFLGSYKFIFDWSIHPSVALVLAAGYLIVRMFEDAEKGGGWLMSALGGLALGAAVNFRLANGLLGAGIAVGFGLLFLHGLRLHAVRLAAVFAAGFIVGCIPMLAANTINAGHPLISTYGPINTQALRLDWPTISLGFKFYFVQHITVLCLLLLPAVALVALYAMRGKLAVGATNRIVVVASVSLAFSMAFFCAYDIRQWYYPFPAIIFAASVAAFLLIRSEMAKPGAGRETDVVGIWLRLGAGAAAMAVTVFFLGSITIPVSKNYISPDIDFFIPPHSVVWSDLSAGYYHLFLNRQAASLAFLDPASQEQLVLAIAKDNIPQFVVADHENGPTLERLRRIIGLRRAGKAFNQEVFEIMAPAGRDPQ
jgi:hypothetical protein